MLDWLRPRAKAAPRAIDPVLWREATAAWLFMRGLDAEVEAMVTLLEKQYKDAYDPKIMPDNQTMVDQLKSQSGAAYDRAFYKNVVLHHQQALKLIDQSLPKMKDTQIRAMAERMKRDQAREISDFQQKAQKR